MPDKSPLHQLADHGQSVWIDFLSRQLLQSGELARMMREDAVVGVTSNPTIFQKAISQGDAYDEQLRECLEQLDDPKEIYLHLTNDDVAEACDLLRSVWDEGKGKDGYVSWEVDPNFAYDYDATYAEAQRLHGLVEKPNLHVKIPATKPGLRAIEDMIALGKNINVTLIFSRVDTEADKRLDAIGGHDHLKGKLGVANSKLAYQNYKEIFAGPRWEALVAKGATKQRCLWASTSVKNPAYRDVMYVEELIGPDTVNTMPQETIEAFQDHGRVADTLEQGIDEAHRLFDELAEAGIDYDDVVRVLEEEGVRKFIDSFAELMDGVRSKKHELVGA